MDAVERNGYELIPHPAYSPDLAPSDFFLFPNLKKDIRECHFWSDEEVVTAVEEWLSGKPENLFSSRLIALKHRHNLVDRHSGDTCNACIESTIFYLYDTIKHYKRHFSLLSYSAFR